MSRHCQFWFDVQTLLWISKYKSIYMEGEIQGDVSIWFLYVILYHFRSIHHFYMWYFYRFRYCNHLITDRVEANKFYFCIFIYGNINFDVFTIPIVFDIISEIYWRMYHYILQFILDIIKLLVFLLISIRQANIFKNFGYMADISC